jgi:hypothetical protein
MQQDECVHCMDKYILHTQANPSGPGKKAILLPIVLDKKRVTEGEILISVISPT